MKQDFDERMKAALQKKTASGSGVGSPVKVNKSKTKKGNMFDNENKLQEDVKAGLNMQLLLEKSVL
jgi:hypothetical protein